MIAEAAHLHGFNATWLPSYGPEMRGGTANCSVIISSKKIPSPIIDNADIIMVFSQQSMDKFYSSLEPDGIIIYDENNVAKLPPPEAIPPATYSLNASEEAKNLGDARIANTVALGILSKFVKQIPRESFVKAIRKIFAKKEKALMLNLQAFEKGESIILKQNNNACQKNNSMP
jgi:2-oxoglutarate ferredoxin oxidoreductase subunit gamma